MPTASIAVSRSEIEEITSLVIKGIECWTKAGELICRIIDSTPDAIDEITRQAPALTPNIIHMLIRVGRRQLMPELLLRSGPAWTRLAQCPIATQQRHMSEPIDVLIRTPNGTDSLKIAAGDMTLSQAKQVFGDGEIRSLQAQRAWLAATETASIPAESRKAYSVHGKFLVVHRECKLSLQEIGVILAEMKT